MSERIALAVILGSGIDYQFGGGLESTASYEELGLPGVGVSGHSGRLSLGKTRGGRRIMVFHGRSHAYEGRSLEELGASVRLAESWGAARVLLTNSAGGIDAGLQVGGLFAIEEILDLQTDALMGRLSRGLLPALGEAPLRLSDGIPEGFGLPCGRYAAVLGPNFETRAEIELLKRLSCRAVGMSTAVEVATCLQLGLPVAAVSVITNSWGAPASPSHAEVLEVSRGSAELLTEIIEAQASSG